MTAFTARALSTDRLQSTVNQATHGFVIGDLITFDGASWVKSLADSLFDCQGTSIVSFVLDVDNFVITQTGFVVNLANAVTPGVQLYLSPTTLGRFTATQPTTTGQVVLPCMVAMTTTSGYFFGGSGVLITPPTEFAYHTITVDTDLLPNNGYFVNSAGHINLTLPTSFVSGDKIEIAGINDTCSFTILQNDIPSQRILIGQQGSTMAGSAGSISSTNSHDSLDLLCVTASTLLMADNIEGNLAFV